MTDQGKRDRRVVPGAAFLLSQVGFQSSRRWGERLSAIGLDPRHVVLLRMVAADEGRSQQALGQRMKLPPPRMVTLVDELEKQDFVERRADPKDRRVRALYLTPAGRKALEKVMKVSAEHEDELCRGLSAPERKELVALLSRVAEEQGLVAGVHPGVALPSRRTMRST